jgi:O-6-methylguanine DNA methyltransferase
MQNDKSKFKNKVYKVVRNISCGNVLTYKEVARLAGSPFAWRAVGNILNKNKDPKVPCHRVIRSDGKVGGYRKGTKKKTSLLKKENIIIKNGRVIKKTFLIP